MLRKKKSRERRSEVSPLKIDVPGLVLEQNVPIADCKTVI
jgi:hypothetical protein